MDPDRPSLDWWTDEDGDVVVHLVGVPGWHIAAHGRTVHHALAALGDAMMLAYDDELTLALHNLREQPKRKN